MNYSSGNSLLSHAEIVSISFFAPALLTIVIALLVLLAYVCKYKSTKNLGTARDTFTMYYNSTADYPPNNATNCDSIAVRLHSAIPEEVEEDEEEGDREGLPISYMLESESDTEQGGSSFILTPDDTLMSSVIDILIPGEEELKLTSEEPTHTNTPTTTEPTSGWHFDLGDPTTTTLWHFDLSDPTTTPQHLSLDDHDFGMFSQSSIDFDETNLGQYGCLPDHRYAHSASQISAAGDYLSIGLNDYSEDASQRIQHMRQKHKKRAKKERQQLATDRRSGDSGVGQSLSPVKSLTPRRVSLTQGAPPLLLGEDHDVNAVMKKPTRHWSVSDPKTVHRKHRCNKRYSAVHTIGRSSDSSKKQHTYVPPNNSLSTDMASHSQPQPSGAAMVGLITEGGHPRLVKSHRHSSSRHNNITETSGTLPLQSNRGVANIVPHASTLTRDELQQRLKEGANNSEYSHTLPRRSKAGLKYRPSREKHHYHQQHPETYRSTGEHLHPEQETASVDFKDTFSSIQHSHHQSLSQTCSCKPSTEDTHTYTLPRKVKKKVKDKVGDDTLTIKHPQCEPQPEADSTPQFKPPAAVIVPDCIRPTATLQDCTSDGREYRDEANGFTLTIGKGAHVKSHRHSSSRHNMISSTLPLQYKRGVANTVPHASTLARDELQQRLKEGANNSEYSHILPRRSKALTQDAPPLSLGEDRDVDDVMKREMPPKTSKTLQKGSSPQELCCICCQKIGPKDEVLFCAGSCQKYLHRYCASISEQSYKELTSNGAPPFLCFYCFKTQKDEQVAMLLKAVDSLKEEINALKSARENDYDVRRPSEAAGEGTGRPIFTSGKTFAASVSTKYGEPITNTTSRMSKNHDNKYNIVLYGVDECPSGMSHQARFQSDLSSIVNTLSTLDSSIVPQFIRDCYRLGKFSPEASRPRPILITFIRIADLSGILSKRGNITQPYSIKPDMSPNERLHESILLKERWNLIQSGVSRKYIRIRADCLYVRNKLHGRVCNSKFVHEASDPGATCTHLDNPKNNNPIVQHDHSPHHHGSSS